nr:ATP-grasp domain-containing protein [uncultured Sediminibacterium sp.]
MIKVIVTGAGGGGIGEQIIKALRNGKNKYFIIATDTTINSCARSLGDEFVLIPPASSGNYVEFLVSLCKKASCKIVIPGSEPELVCMASSIKLFIENSIYVPINSIEVLKICSDKLLFQDFLSKNNFNLCDTYLVDENSNISNLVNYPYIIKPVSGSGSKNVFIVQDESELKSILHYLKDNGKILVQQYVGSESEEYTVGVLCTPSGYIHHIILQRNLSLGLSVRQKVINRTSKQFLGPYLVVSTGISQGKFVDNPLIDDQVKKIVKLLSPTSTINIQCRVQNDKVFIFEINPRFSGTTNLRTLVGFNEPEYLINDYLGKKNQQICSADWLNKIVLRGIQEYLINNNE